MTPSIQSMPEQRPDTRRDTRPDQSGPAIFLVLVLLTAFLVIVGGVGNGAIGGPERGTHTSLPEGTFLPQATAQPVLPAPARPEAAAPEGLPSPLIEPELKPQAPQVPAAPAAPSGLERPVPALPGGGTKVFDNRFLVAYYGTAGSGSMGVLGEATPERITPRLRKAARGFARPGERVQIVYELIVTVADRHPGKDGDYSHEIPREQVRRYIEAAHRHGALLILDIQPGRSDFLTLAKRWEWALRDPWVGLALDPEWRMGPHQVPGHRIGSVRASEINQTSAWLDSLVSRERLPQKLFVLHQFRTSMIKRIDRVVPRPGLASVQHVDGFGTRHDKRATYHAVARPRQFTMGFKLFYDEDIRRMGAADVHRIRPKVSFVSFQ